MNNAGVFTLVAMQIAAAKQLTLVTPTVDLDGMSAVTLEANFQYGSGGASCSVIAATSFDAGSTWRHIARFDFLLAARVAIANLTALSPKAIATYADLASEGVNDGMLGDRLAVFVVSTGNYANTALSVRASVR
jgi:hypothetical protein